MTQTVDSPVNEIAREACAADIACTGVEPVTGVTRPEGSAPPNFPRWTGALPPSSHGVMAVVGDDGYLIPLWTAGDLLHACRIYWHSASD